MNHRYINIMEAALTYVSEEKPKVQSPAEVVKLMRPLLQEEEQETFWCIMLNVKKRAIGIEFVTKGLVDRSQLHAREVFREAIRQNASRIICVHNHPSGDPTPSSQDIKCTNELVAAGKIIGIEITDHVIIGHETNTHKGHVSFREEALL